MDLVNETLLQVHIARSQLAYKDLLQAIVVVKGSFDVLDSGETRPADEQADVLQEDTETPFGMLETEVVPAKAWCDLAVLGHAHTPSPAGEPVPRAEVSLRIGAFERRVRVSGDRVWQKALGRLQPSEPAGFTKLPLTYDRAFGGFGRQHGFDVPHHDNPVGKGYVLAREDAEGTPLPNFEEVDQLIESWSDRPMPAGLAPLSRATAWRGQRGYELEESTQTVHVRPAAFCFAHPRMNLPAYPDGQAVELCGVRAGGALWRFRLPTFRHWVGVELGAQRYQLPVVADTVYFHPDEGRVVVVGRRSFIYQFVPERVRSTRVMASPDATAYGATTSIRELRAAPRADVPVVVEPADFIDLPLEAMLRHHPMTDLIESLPLCPSG